VIVSLKPTYDGCFVLDSLKRSESRSEFCCKYCCCEVQKTQKYKKELKKNRNSEIKKLCRYLNQVPVTRLSFALTFVA